MEQRKMYFTDTLQLRSEESETSELIIEGYFAVFNTPTQLTHGLYEELSPSAFENSLQNNDIRCLFNHDSAVVLGRTGNQTLQLHTDEHGLYGKVIINPNDKQAVDIYERVKRGDIIGCSFGFFPMDEELIQLEGGVKYLVTDANTIEVSIVTFPQYPETEVKARSKQLNDYKSEQLRAHKKQLLERIERMK